MLPNIVSNMRQLNRVGDKRLCFLLDRNPSSSLFFSALARVYRVVHVCWVLICLTDFLFLLCLLWDHCHFSPKYTSQYTVCTYTNTGWIPSKPTKKNQKKQLLNLTAFCQTPSGDCTASLGKKESSYVETVIKISIWNWQMHKFIAND